MSDWRTKGASAGSDPSSRHVIMVSWATDRTKSAHSIILTRCCVACLLILVGAGNVFSDEYIDRIRQQRAAARAETYLLEAKSALTRGDYLKAIRVLSSAMRNGAGVEAYRLRAQAYCMKGAYAEAAADLTRVIDAGSSSPEDLVQRADIYNSAFDYDKAINDYCTSIQMDPLYLDAYRGRATAYMAREKYDLAVKDLQVVLRSNPSDSESLYNAGMACMLADLPAAATSFFDKALEGEKSDHWRTLVRVQMARLSEASAYEERVGGLAGYLANIGVEPRGEQLLAGRSQSEAKQQKGIAGISDQRQVAAMKSDFATLRKDLTSPRPEDSHLTGDLSGTHMGFAWGFHFDSKGRSVSGILRIRGPAGFEETHSCTGTLDRGLVEMSDHTGYRFQGRINEALRLTGTLYTSRGQSFSVDVPLRE